MASWLLLLLLLLGSEKKGRGFDSFSRGGEAGFRWHGRRKARVYKIAFQVVDCPRDVEMGAVDCPDVATSGS